MWETLAALLRFLVSFAVVAALAYYAARWIGRQAAPAGRGGALRLESTLPLGGRRAVGVLRADGRRFLIAMTDQQVGLIAELGPTESNSAGNAGTAAGAGAAGKGEPGNV